MKFKDKIKPYQLFSDEILNVKVNTAQFGRTKYINLDNAATTPPFLCVEEGIKKYLKTYGSVHRGSGFKSKISTDIYEDSRDKILKIVNAPKNSYLMLTGNTTGAMNMASYFFAFLNGKVAVSDIEHSSSWLPWIKSEGIKMLKGKGYTLEEINKLNEKIQQLGKKNVITYAVNKNFEFDFADIEKVLRNNKIKAFVLTASSNATGYCPEIKKIGKLVHKYNAYFIVDACQFIQHHKIDMQKMGIDFLAASGHKFYAPYGGGFLIGPKKFLDNFLPYQIGGGNLPYITKDGIFLKYKNNLAHDPGTPNALGAVSMAIALEKINEIGMRNIERHEKGLTKYVYDYLKTNPKIKIYVNEKHLNTVIPFNFTDFNSLEAADILNNRFGIGVRAGNFCVYHVARKLLGIKDEKQIIKSVKKGKTEDIPGFIRASFGICNSKKDAKRFIEAVKILTN